MRQLALIALGSLLSGFLFAAALPPADWQTAGWFCFVPLLASLKGARLVYVVLAAIGAGLFGAWVTTTGILYSGPRLEGEEAWHYAGFLMFMVAICPGLLAASRLQKASFIVLALLAALFVCCESLLLLYLPAHLALTQYRSPLMLELASWTGIWGVSFVLWFFQLLVVERGSQLLAEVRTKTPKGWLVGTACLITPLVVGWKQPTAFSGRHESMPEGRGMVRLAVLQTTSPDVTQMVDWNRVAFYDNADLTVWPELSAVGIAAGGKTDKLRELSRAPQQPAFVTTFSDAAKPIPHNAAAIFFQGMESARYFKRKPFGGESGEHQAGDSPLAVEVNGLVAGLNVCFDSCYPSVMRETVLKKNVDVIALPCMGPESPYGVIQAIHGAFTPFRSAELGVPIARAESSAYAMITDHRGRIIVEAKPGYEGIITGLVDKWTRWTLIKAIGDWFIYVCWAAVAFWCLKPPLDLLLGKRQAQPESLETTLPSASIS